MVSYPWSGAQTHPSRGSLNAGRRLPVQMPPTESRTCPRRGTATAHHLRDSTTAVSNKCGSVLPCAAGTAQGRVTAQALREPPGGVEFPLGWRRQQPEGVSFSILKQTPFCLTLESEARPLLWKSGKGETNGSGRKRMEWAGGGSLRRPWPPPPGHRVPRRPLWRPRGGERVAATRGVRGLRSPLGSHGSHLRRSRLAHVLARC